jgi:hypothetical protein
MKTLFSSLGRVVGYASNRETKNSSVDSQPVAQTRTQFANAFDTVEASGKFRAQQSRFGRLVSEPSKRGHLHVDNPGGETAHLEVKAVAPNDCFSSAGRAGAGFHPNLLRQRCSASSRWNARAEDYSTPKYYLQNRY